MEYLSIFFLLVFCEKENIIMKKYAYKLFIQSIR
jgi:hypothetical protein